MAGETTGKPSWTRADPLFRFVQVRAPEVTRTNHDKKLPRVRTYFPDSPTAFHSALKVAFERGATTDMFDLAKRFLTDSDRGRWQGAIFYGSTKIPTWLTSIDDFLLAHDPPDVSDFEQTLISTLARDTAFLSDETFRWSPFVDTLKTVWRDVGDSVIAVSIWPFASPASQAILMRTIRLICVLNEIVESEWKLPAKIKDSPPKALKDTFKAERLQTSMLDGLVLLPSDIFPLPSPNPPSAQQKRSQSLTAKINKSEGDHIRVRIARAAMELSKAMAAVQRDRLPITEEVLDVLSDDTTHLLSSMQGIRDLKVSELIDRLDRRMGSEPALKLKMPEPTIAAALRIMVRHDQAIDLKHGLISEDATNFGIDWTAANLTRSPVVGDLHVVQQELLRYEEGEIADIENVLAKERKLHVHEFKEIQETETTTITEHEEERTHDNQTTDRLELSQESSRQVATTAALEAGATLSASYGSVQIGANAQFSYATSSSESNRSASKFSKEVVDRSVERIKDRRVEQRRTLRRQELLDRNEHEFKNETSSHVTGIYQWVDKVYEAATFNYGLRMMLDVTVPEPALFWQFAKALSTASTVTADPPPPLEIDDPVNAQPRELKARDIGILVSIDDLAATFRIRGLKPPPPRWVTKGIKLTTETAPPADKHGSDLPSLSTKADEIKLPKGYVPRWYTAVATLVFDAYGHDGIDGHRPLPTDGTDRERYTKHLGNPPNLTIYDHGLFGQNTLTVGPIVDVLTPGTATLITHTFREVQLDNMNWVGATGDVGEEGTLPVALSVIGSATFVATVSVVCERSDATFLAWQLEQYEAVVTAWETWKQEFEAAVRSSQNSGSVGSAPSVTTNSALSGTVITTELRRLFLQMLNVPILGSVGAVDSYDLSDPTKPKPPLLHPSVAAQMGRQIQFVEQAFEWPQLTYRLYPYYWKPSGAWAKAMVLQDADTTFAEFLRAGSARLIVPVRPGFEIAVCSHLGISPPLPWQAGKPPIVDTDPYISIAEEIKASQTDLVEPVRIDTPWIVRLPTTLIKLKADANLPIYREPTSLPIPAAPTP